MGATTLFGRVEGVGGAIEVPFIGIRVATIGSWKLTRRGDEGRDAGLFNLRAALSYVNETLWEDPDYEKEVRVELARGRVTYVMERAEGSSVKIEGRTLVMEGVSPCRIEP